MNKKSIVTLAVGLIVSASSVSAEVLERWTYDEDAGKRLDQCSNSGTVGTPWGWGDPTKWISDGNGNMEVLSGPGVGNDYKASQAFPAALDANQTYTMEIKIGEWAAAGPDSQVKWRLRTASSSGAINAIQTILNETTGLSFTLISGGSNYRSYPGGGVTGSNATAKIVFNPAAGTSTYYVNGVEQDSFSGLTMNPMEMFGLNKEGGAGAWTNSNKVLKIDEQSLSTAAEPEGVYVYDKAIVTETSDTSTNVFKVFNVQTGDVVVVVSASSANAEPDINSVVIGGGTATLDPVVTGYADEFAGPQTRYWYTTATSDGTVPVEQLHGPGAYWCMAAYQLRSGSGYQEITLLGGPQESFINPTTTIGSSYTLGTNYAGVYIEALSSYSQHWESENSNTVVNVAGYQNQRIIASGNFDGLASLDNVWSMTNAPGQVSLIGLAFGSTSVVLSNMELYEQWLAGFSVGAETDLLDDADGDLINNLTEYAWDGEPDNVLDQGNVPVHSMSSENSTNYMVYVYYERDDAAARGLVSTVDASTDLTAGGWSPASVEPVGSGPAGVPDTTAVTNRVPSDAEAEQFVRLQVELTP